MPPKYSNYNTKIMKNLYSFLVLFFCCLVNIISAQDNVYSASLYVNCVDLKTNVQLPSNETCLYNEADIASKLEYLKMNSNINIDVNILFSSVDCKYEFLDDKVFGPEITNGKNIWFQENCTDYLIIMKPGTVLIYDSAKELKSIDYREISEIEVSGLLRGSYPDVANYNYLIGALNYILNKENETERFDYHQPSTKIKSDVLSNYFQEVGIVDELAEATASTENSSYFGGYWQYKSFSDFGYFFVPMVSYYPSYYNYMSLDDDKARYFSKHKNVIRVQDININDMLFGLAVSTTANKAVKAYKYKRVQEGGAPFVSQNQLDRLSPNDYNRLIKKVNDGKNVSRIMTSFKMNDALNDLLKAKIDTFNQYQGSCTYTGNIQFNLEQSGLSGSVYMHPDDKDMLVYSANNLPETSISVGGV